MRAVRKLSDLQIQSIPHWCQ